MRPLADDSSARGAKRKLAYREIAPLTFVAALVLGALALALPAFEGDVARRAVVVVLARLLLLCDRRADGRLITVTGRNNIKR